MNRSRWPWVEISNDTSVPAWRHAVAPSVSPFVPLFGPLFGPLADTGDGVGQHTLRPTTTDVCDDVTTLKEHSMRIEKDRVPVKMEIPGAVIRQQTDFGDATGLGKISGECFTLSAGVDTTPLFQGLEGNLCQCPHWGFVIKGTLTTTDAAGGQETVKTNDLFELHCRNFRKIHDAGMVIVVGTDGTGDGFGAHEQVASYARCGMTASVTGPPTLSK